MHTLRVPSCKLIPIRTVQTSVQPKAPSESEHFNRNPQNKSDYLLPHPIWSEEEMKSVEITHRPPKDFVDKYAYFSVQLLRFGFDFMSGYLFGRMNEQKWLIRIIFLETVAGVPGMMGAMVRHLQSLRKMKRDMGWIHTLLEEAENERMHLLTALELRQPGRLFRTAVLVTQGVFSNLFFLTYLVSPRYCHRFVGYLEEEAVKTYSHLLHDIEHGPMTEWKTKAAPEFAKKYWKLPQDATMKDVIMAIRSDESHHRNVNHKLSELGCDEPNPYGPGR